MGTQRIPGGFKIFNGTHVIEVVRRRDLMRGFQLGIAQANASGDPIEPISHDSNKLYAGGGWAGQRMKLLEEIVLHLLPMEEGE